MKTSWRGRSITAILLLSFLFLSFSPSIVRAPPVLHSVTVSESGDHTILTMEINQTVWEGCEACGCDYSQVNYVVTAVAVKLDDGEPVVQNVTASEDAVITVIFDLGVLESRPQAEIRVCTESGGWAPWFESFEVPEFTLVPVVLLFVALTMSVALLKLGRNRVISCDWKNG
jgi:hypothetical protein